MKLGQGAQDIFPKTHTLEQASGPTFYTLGFLVALILWAFGLVWLFFASASIARSKSFPFNIGWWGFTFPLGVFSASTCQMGKELPSRFFDILGTVSSVYLAGGWTTPDSFPDTFTVCHSVVDYCQHRDTERSHLGQDILRAVFGGFEGAGGGEGCREGSMSCVDSQLIACEPRLWIQYYININLIHSSLLSF